MRATVLLLLVALPAAGDEPPVLHEYVPPPGDKGGRVVGDRGDTENPSAIRSGARVLPEPAKEQGRSAEEPLHAPGPGTAEMRPDYQTSADSTLHYSEVFNPSVVPFKRSQALDAVKSDYTLHVGDGSLDDVRVGGRVKPDRDLFWASLVIEVVPGQATPIPSVSPDMRILSYEAEPRAKLSFARDGADNFYVRGAARGVYRLVFLADAGAGYFAPQIPTGYTVERAAALGGARPVPAAVKDTASRVLSLLGVTRRTRLDEALDRMISYFRGFEAGSPPAATGDVYLDLTSAKRGVCRHRAFAFVITANAAGIPARYVTNEAHAFAEVKVPDRGWVRVDLGGAAAELDIANAADKTLYRPRAADPFPRPEAYAENYTRLRGDVRGLSRDQLAEAERAPEAAVSDPRSTAPLVGAPGTALPVPRSTPGKRSVRVSITTATHRVFRGESLEVAGRIVDGDAGVAGLRVNLYLAPAGAGGRGARQVGETVTDGDGGFRQTLALPLDFPLGDHEVYAATPGNDTVGAAVSD